MIKKQTDRDLIELDQTTAPKSQKNRKGIIKSFEGNNKTTWR